MRSIKACVIIFLFDVLALLLAFFISREFAFIIASNILHSAPSHQFFIEATGNKVYSYLVMSLGILFTFYNRGHYMRRIPWWNQVRYIVITLSIVFFIDGFAHFAVQNEFARLWVGTSWIIAFMLILLSRGISRTVCEMMQIWKVPTIVIGSGDNAIDTMFAINSDGFTGYQIKTLILHSGYKAFDRNVLPHEYQDVNIIDGSSDYSDYIGSHREHFYIIAPDSLNDINVELLLENLGNANSSYAIVPPINGLALYGHTPQYFLGYDIMFMQPRPRLNSPFGKLLKRCMDIYASLALLLILSPLFLIIALMIKRGGGSVFFLNKRLGKGGKYFNCLKFRTMVPDAEKILNEVLANNPEERERWETHRKMKNDPRVTGIGKFLRKSSLDELPQLVNILKGEMSLVGPRPIVSEEVVYFNKAELESYCSLRPGISGLWQVSGRSNTSFKQRVHLDSWYVTNWSIWYDIVIMFKTFSAVVKRSGAC